MSKRVDTSGLDAGYIIGQAVKSNREAKPAPAPAPAPPPTADPVAAVPVETPEPEVRTVIAAPPSTEPEPSRETKEQTRRKRGQSANYKETFLKRNEIKTRQCVYISYEVHAVIAKLVRTLIDEGNDISVGGYIDTVLWEHLQLNKDEINELYRHQRGDLV